EERELHHAGPARTGVHEPRFRVVQEFRVQRHTKVPVQGVVYKRLQQPAAVPRRQRQSETRLHEWRHDECRFWCASSKSEVRPAYRSARVQTVLLILTAPFSLEGGAARLSLAASW